MTNAPVLYMLLLGSRAPGRTVEQHDYFFAIASSSKELVPLINEFWPEAKGSIHVDAVREVRNVDGYSISILPREECTAATEEKLFFINLGGYQENRFEELHHTLLTVQPTISKAVQQAKKTAFYKNNSIEGGNSHIDDKYGVDVDEVYNIEDLLSATQKQQYQIHIAPATGLAADIVRLGYIKLNKL